MKILKEGYQVRIKVKQTFMPLVGTITALNGTQITVKTIIPVRGQDIFIVDRRDVNLTQEQEESVSSIEFQNEIDSALQKLKQDYNV
tara:strand:- start:962 stop:1222 length:261 start_codon:yes stop_codon:yes gene_type:complete